MGWWLLALLACGTEWSLEDNDADGYTWLDGDCDDADSDVNPSVDELCDGVDNDCDGVTDGAQSIDGITWYGDADGDGFSGDSVIVQACTRPDGYSQEVEDCDDVSAAVNPDATEYCDDRDNNCDGEIDEDAAFDARTWYGDADGDGYGLDTDVQVSCEAPDGYVAEGGDCNDANDAISPGAAEIDDDSIDNDCDGNIDE